MQTDFLVDNLYVMSKPIFWKNIISLSSAEFAQRMVNRILNTKFVCRFFSSHLEFTYTYGSRLNATRTSILMFLPEVDERK